MDSIPHQDQEHHKPSTNPSFFSIADQSETPATQVSLSKHHCRSSLANLSHARELLHCNPTLHFFIYTENSHKLSLISFLLHLSILTFGLHHFTTIRKHINFTRNLPPELTNRLKQITFGILPYRKSAAVVTPQAHPPSRSPSLRCCQPR